MRLVTSDGVPVYCDNCGEAVHTAVETDGGERLCRQCVEEAALLMRSHDGQHDTHGLALR